MAFQKAQESVLFVVVAEAERREVAPFFARPQMVDDNDVVFALLVLAPDTGAATPARASGPDPIYVLLAG